MIVPHGVKEKAQIAVQMLKSAVLGPHDPPFSPLGHICFHGIELAGTSGRMEGTWSNRPSSSDQSNPACRSVPPGLYAANPRLFMTGNR